MESRTGHQAPGGRRLAGGGHSVGMGCVGDPAEDGGVVPLSNIEAIPEPSVSGDPVGASLLAIAVGQSMMTRLIHRYREQARSHICFWLMAKPASVTCMDMSNPDRSGNTPSVISSLVFLFVARAPIMAAFFAQ
ncbi:DUF1534 domain-containing protein [Pseudomonas mediterranea]